MFQLRSLPKQGFTMMEMATTLVVAGIITTVGIVAVAPAVEHAKVRSAANVVAGDLQYAQALAAETRDEAMAQARQARLPRWAMEELQELADFLLYRLY